MDICGCRQTMFVHCITHKHNKHTPTGSARSVELRPQSFPAIEIRKPICSTTIEYTAARDPIWPTAMHATSVSGYKIVHTGPPVRLHWRREHNVQHVVRSSCAPLARVDRPLWSSFRAVRPLLWTSPATAAHFS